MSESVDRPGSPLLTRGVTVGAVGSVYLVALLVVVLACWARDRQAGEAFDVVRWERETIAGRWLNLVGRPVRHDPPEDEAIRRYFSLPRTDPEAQRLENQVERVIEGRIDATLRDLGIHAGPTWPRTIFPFVDIELASSPQVLVESPRSKIERVRADLLRPDLTQQQSIAIEKRSERERPDRRALVVPSGGVATYPAVVTNDGDYADTVATAAHEWTHHYLTFYALGRSYFTSRDSETINETVADLIGDEVGALILERWGDPTRSAPPPPASPRRTDLNATLRALRTEVDGLLAAGKVDEAETRMETVRGDLVLRGTSIRVINQAFFAWYGTYAARPDSVDPLGAQLREIRERSGSLPEFVRAIREVTSRGDIEGLLTRLRGSG